MRYRFLRPVAWFEVKLYKMLRTIRGMFDLTPKGLTVSTLFCIGIIIVNALVWDTMPEPFNGAAVLSSAAIDLLLAYVAGYIFYILTTVATEYKKQQFIYFSVMQYQITSIAQAYSGLLTHLVNKGEYISTFDVFALCGSKDALPILVEDTATQSVDDRAATSQDMTWLDQMASICHAEDRAIKKMLRYELELGLEVRTLLVTLLDTNYKDMVSIMQDPKNKGENRSFEPIIYMMHEHLSILSKLQDDIINVIAGKKL